MEIEIIKNKVYYRIFDLSFPNSTGIYSLHKYHDTTKIAEIQNNISAIQKSLNIHSVLMLKQVHGHEVVYATHNNIDQPLEGDGSITDHHGIALSIVTADCVPILLASTDGAVIGAGHCGWRSTKSNIIQHIVHNMRCKGANNIKAAIGPAIQQYSYEVDNDYCHQFILDDPQSQSFFIPAERSGYFMFNLVGLVQQKLEQQNVDVVSVSQHDTYSMPQHYPSYRRSTHQGIPCTQSILSTIRIK